MLNSCTPLDGTIHCISISDAYVKNDVDGDVIVEVGVQHKNDGHKLVGMFKWKK